MSDARGLDELVRTAMDDGAEEVRAEAVEALSETRHPRWLKDALLPLLARTGTRRAAARVLSRKLDSRYLRHRQALGPLLEALFAEPDEETRRALDSALTGSRARGTISESSRWLGEMNHTTDRNRTGE
jgi:uncharacterized protein (DUF2336 family)